MRKFLLFLLVIELTGCVSAKIPNYLNDKVPYKRDFYAGYDETLSAVKESLENLGWKIASEADPAVYEAQLLTGDADRKETLIFTNVRQTPFILGTRYAKMNILVRRLSETTEVEIRYVTITSTVFKSFENYKNDSAVARVFEQIEQLLKT